ncbi:hypothetical protein [Streptomyces sp. NPDC046985]|uniref:hypothetical protein n=1 Tax=Streptomyces sp. NPDC046985 TaxID=3155377 RepID=UPI0033E79F00
MTALIESPARLDHPELHATGDPHGHWAWMRAYAPVRWQPPGAVPGFWSPTRYEDVRAVCRDAAAFSSAYGVLLRGLDLGDDPGGGLTVARTDAPRHRRPAPPAPRATGAPRHRRPAPPAPRATGAPRHRRLRSLAVNGPERPPVRLIAR